MNKLSKSSVIKACAKAQLEANVWRENLNRATSERDKVKAAIKYGVALGKIEAGKEWLFSGKTDSEVFAIERRITNLARVVHGDECETKAYLREVGLNGGK